MKNKKLFAILTLVCFMFTLMPVAAFATTPAPTATLSDGRLVKAGVEEGISFEVENVANVKETTEVKVELYAGKDLLSTKTREFKNLTGTTCTFYTNSTSSSWTETAWTAFDYVVPTGAILYFDGVKIDEAGVLASVATNWAATDGVVNTATAGNIDDATSTFVAEDGDQSVKIGEDVVFELDVEDKTYGPAAGTVFIWAEETAGKASSALNIVTAGATEVMNNVWAIVVHDYADVKVDFTRAGEYTVYAAPAVDVTSADTNEVAELSKFDCEFSVIKVRSGAVDPEEAYKANGVAANNELTGVYGVAPNNVFDDEYEVVFTSNGQPMKGKTITIETNSASIEVSKASDKTDSQGKIDFAIAASVEGTYEVILSVDGVEWTIPVTVGNTAATYIENVKAPKAPLALWADFEDEDAVAFTITDINGNVFNGGEGMDGIADNDETGKYVVLTEAPAESDLESKDLKLAWDAADKVWYLEGVDAMDAEGTYAVKVILDNGSYATAEWTVKKFDKPVRLILGYATNTVELGSATTAKMIYIDKNGVQKLAKDADFAATGYAVADAGIDNSKNFPTAYVTNGDGYGKIIVKSDEKYVGETIKVTAVSTKYDLVGTATLTVAEGASEIAFADAKADVDVNNKLVWNVVDAAGNKVTLTNGIKATTTDIKYIVLDKPEGAKVSVNDATNVKDLNSEGEGAMRLVSNKVGNVTVQVILKAEYAATAGDDNMQIKYYTGTVVVPVGTDSTGDVVVMSIGSNQIVKNDEVATMAAAPIVKDNRTFVPFRALAEAFGAEVEWVEATQSVVAELNGVKVVMNIGEAAYTVNGVAATADVAPFINGASTMVPVRFVAEAFGINVIPTYDNNGATADILFNL